jgi:Fe2+ transport system protein FeoA
MKKKSPRCLSELKPGETATIFQTPAEHERLAEIGLIQGETVTFVKAAPLGDPVILRVLDASVIVRRADLATVFVV